MRTIKKSIVVKKKNKENIQYNLMTSIGIIHLLIFSYLPMLGLVMAFQKYNIADGMFGSKFIGFENFKFFFTSQDAMRVTVNTLWLNIFFILTNLIASVGFALILFEITQPKLVKVYQTVAILPHFISWVVVGYMSFALLNPNFGFINNFLSSLGIEGVDWYSEAKYWPAILTFANIWKSLGINSVIYYAGLMSINNEYFEVADLDGATKWQKICNVSLPNIYPLMIIMTILALGGIFRSDFGMFYQLTRDVGKLYSTTDVIDTYIFRSLNTYGNVGMSTAVGFYQSVVGLFTIVTANAIVRKIDKDSAMF